MSNLNLLRAREVLQSFDFETLFIEELGWDYADRAPLDIHMDGRGFTIGRRGSEARRGRAALYSEVGRTQKACPERSRREGATHQRAYFRRR